MPKRSCNVIVSSIQVNEFNVQFQAEVHVQVESLLGISLLQKHPDSIRRRILEQCLIFWTESDVPLVAAPRPTPADRGRAA